MLNEYEDPTLNEGKGGPRNVKGNESGPFVVIIDPDTNQPIEHDGTPLAILPVGTLIPLTTDPTALPTTPLEGRKWLRFHNEDVIDIQLCDSTGNVFDTLKPGEWSSIYYALSTLVFYGKVATGTADIGVRVVEGGQPAPPASLWVDVSSMENLVVGYDKLRFYRLDNLTWVNVKDLTGLQLILPESGSDIFLVIDNDLCSLNKSTGEIELFDTLNGEFIRLTPNRVGVFSDHISLGPYLSDEVPLGTTYIPTDIVDAWTFGYGNYTIVLTNSSIDKYAYPDGNEIIDTIDLSTHGTILGLGHQDNDGYWYQLVITSTGIVKINMDTFEYVEKTALPTQEDFIAIHGRLYLESSFLNATGYFPEAILVVGLSFGDYLVLYDDHILRHVWNENTSSFDTTNISLPENSPHYLAWVNPDGAN